MKSKYAYKDNRLSVSIIELTMNITDTCFCACSN